MATKGRAKLIELDDWDEGCLRLRGWIATAFIALITGGLMALYEASQGGLFALSLPLKLKALDSVSAACCAAHSMFFAVCSCNCRMWRTSTSVTCCLIIG